MKKILFLLVIVSLAYSCQKNELVPEDEIPNWLKERIAQDELAIEDDPQSGLDMAAWIRYKFEKRYYFEYYNMYSSSLPINYTYEGVVMSYSSTVYDEYLDNRCCKRYVWKGPSYIGD